MHERIAHIISPVRGGIDYHDRLWDKAVLEVIKAGYRPGGYQWVAFNAILDDDSPKDREQGMAIGHAALKALRPGVDVVVVRGWMKWGETNPESWVTRPIPRTYHPDNAVEIPYFVSAGMKADLDAVPEGVQIIWGGLDEAEPWEPCEQDDYASPYTADDALQLEGVMRDYDTLVERVKYLGYNRCPPDEYCHTCISDYCRDHILDGLTPPNDEALDDDETDDDDDLKASEIIGLPMATRRKILSMSARLAEIDGVYSGDGIETVPTTMHLHERINAQQAQINNLQRCIEGLEGGA